MEWDSLLGREAKRERMFGGEKSWKMRGCGGGEDNGVNKFQWLLVRTVTEEELKK